jgi:class 3 adenylate cyclase
MNYSGLIRKVLFSKESNISEKYLPFVGYIGIPANLLFYVTCKTQGNWESLPLRIVTSLLYCFFLFFPKNKPYNSTQKIISEVILIFTLTIFFSYMFCKNEMNTYWYISLMWGGMIYGMTTSKAYIPLISFPIGFFAGVYMYFLEPGAHYYLLRRYIGPLSVGWSSAVIFSAVQLAFNVFYLLSVDAESMKIKADEAEKRKNVLETKNEELLARNAIISTFVRPSVLNEVNQGRDPRSFKPRITDKAILICDMRGFTPLTSEMVDAEIQAQFINKYFEMMIAPVFNAGGEVDKLMGDAIMAVFSDGAKALTAALEMRNKLQIYNKQLVFAGHKKINNVITISKGKTLEANIGADLKLDRTYIGTAVNVCARLETVAKFYGLDVIVTKEILDDIPEYQDCRLIDIIKVKGYDTKFEVYEIYGHQAESVRAFKNGTKDKLYEGITNHLQKGRMMDAMKVFKEILSQMPMHNHQPDQIMDPIVYYFATRCLYFVNNPEKLKHTINIENGYHDFGKETIPEDWTNVSLDDIITQMEKSLS